MLPRAAAFAVFFVSLSSAAQADETASLANAIAVEQIVDVAQTEHGLHDVRCRSFPDPADPGQALAHACAPAITEADPLARPFVHSTVTAVLAAAALNIGARAIGAHVPASRYALAGVALFYPLILVHNAHELRIAVSFRP